MTTVPYPNATATPPVTVPAPVGTDAPVASEAPLAYPLPAQLAKEGTLAQQSAFEAEMVKEHGPLPPGVTVGPGGQVSGSISDIAAWVQQQGTQTTATVDPTVAQGQSAYEQIWGVTPPHGYIEKLVKAGFNVFQIQLHELSMPGANRTQYWRDNEASVAKAISNLMGRR